MSVNDEQPAPKPSTKTPSWQLVIELCEAAWPMTDPTANKVVEAMRERDRNGRAKYGEPLTAGNGRKHLVDALQEQLDYVVYLQTELHERGVVIDPQAGYTGENRDEMILVQMFLTGLATLPALYELCEQTYGTDVFGPIAEACQK